MKLYVGCLLTISIALASCSIGMSSRSTQVGSGVAGNSGGSNGSSSSSSSSSTNSSGGTNSNSGSSSGSTGGPTYDTASAAHWFSSSFFLNQSVQNAAIDSQSTTIINNLIANGGWGNNNRFQIDFSIDVHYTSAPTVQLPFQDQGVYMPDSDTLAQIPVPASGGGEGFESSQGTTCDGGDCHYLAVDVTNKKLIEVWEANVSGGFFQSSGALVVWDFTKTYPVNLRGDVCTSADAGGFPIAPMLFTAEEVAAGVINHAIRFILPNSRIQYRQYVRPATHGTNGNNGSGGPGVPYGARFRLKPSYQVHSLPSAGAQVVATALQKYGMILADGGQIALTAKSDQYSTAKWGSMLGSGDLSALQPSDFEMIDGGSRINFSSYDCVRTP